MTERLHFHFHFHALEKEMATHSSVLAWRIPGTGEPGGLQSMGSHKVGHDWNDLAVATAAAWCLSLEVKASARNAGDLGSIPGWGRFPWRRKCNPLQYSCLENPMDGGAWWATVYRLAQSRTRLSNFTFTFMVPQDSQIKLVKHPFHFP